MKNLRTLASAAALSALAVVCVVACGTQETRVDAPASDVAKATVGPDGGKLSGKGILLDIPPGALDAPVELSVESGLPAPAGRTALATWRFSPSGLAFKKPIVVAVELPDGASGTLWWSVEGDDNAFEPRAVIAGGKGRGLVRHFSVGTADPKSCEEERTPEGNCACRAGDAVAELLCKTQPAAANEACPDPVNAFNGQNGGGCSGYGRRDEMGTRCFCKSSDGNYLCPVPHQLTPMQLCPSPEGLGSYYDVANGQGCSGTYVDLNPNTGMTENKSASGNIVECEPRVKATKWESVGGTLECAAAGGDGGLGQMNVKPKTVDFDDGIGFRAKKVQPGVDDECSAGFVAGDVHDPKECVTAGGAVQCTTAKHFPCAGPHVHGTCSGVRKKADGTCVKTGPKKAFECSGPFVKVAQLPPCGNSTSCGTGGPETSGVFLQ